VKEVAKFIAAVLKDGKVLHTDVDLDQKTGDLSATFSLSGATGSELAVGFDAIGKRPSLFAGLLKKDAAFNGMGHMKLPEPLAKALVDVIDEARAMALGSIQDGAKKQQVDALFNALMPTFKSSDFDGALVVTSNGKNLTLLTASKVKDGTALGKTVRELVTAKDIPPEVRNNIKFDVATVGKTSVCKVQLPLPADDHATKLAGLFGEPTLYVAFRNDALFLSFGKDGLEAIKAAIPVQASAVGPMLYYEVDVARLISLIHPEQADKVKKIFPGGQGGTIRFSAEGGPALTIRLSTKVAVLQLLGQLHDMKRASN
jgi:hypothetical protein